MKFALQNSIEEPVTIPEAIAVSRRHDHVVGGEYMVTLELRFPMKYANSKDILDQIFADSPVGRLCAILLTPIDPKSVKWNCVETIDTPAEPTP